MNFGIDTAFALFCLTSGAEATVVEHHQRYDEPSPAALAAAWKAVDAQGISRSKVKTVAVCDFTKPSYVPRMDIYRSGSSRTRDRYLCAHGGNTGDIFATKFSNTHRSKQTSLGLYRVGKVYSGTYGKSLKLHGLESGKNDQAYSRAIVLHSAWYSNESTIRQNIAEGVGPRIGRSQGCPAVPQKDLRAVLSKLRPGTYIYIHGKN